MQKETLMKPAKTSKHLSHLMAASALAALMFAAPAAYTEEDPTAIEGEEELEYIEIDEILMDDEKPAEKAAAEEKPAEDEEFINIDEVLYGTEDPNEIKRIQQAEEQVVETPTRQSLDTEMQTLKEKVVNVNRDLFVLEEDLLFPSSTQVNVFVSMDADQYFKLDGVTLKINDRPISNHLYTKREVGALQRGAVQRLYTGNLTSGEHELVALVTGIGPEGREYRRAVSVAFEKGSDTKYIELKIQGDKVRQQPAFRFKEWE